MDPYRNYYITIDGDSNCPSQLLCAASVQGGSAGLLNPSGMSDISSRRFYDLLSLPTAPSVPPTLGRKATVVNQEHTSLRKHISLREILSMRVMENRTVNEQTASEENNRSNPFHYSNHPADFSNIHLQNMPIQQREDHPPEIIEISEEYNRGNSPHCNNHPAESSNIHLQNMPIQQREDHPPENIKILDSNTDDKVKQFCFEFILTDLQNMPFQQREDHPPEIIEISEENNRSNPPHCSNNPVEFSNIHLQNQQREDLSPEIIEILDRNTDDKFKQFCFKFILTGDRGELPKNCEKRGRKRVDKSRFYCHECGKIEQVLWRKGPDGVNTLCNACGLQYSRNLKENEEMKNKKRLNGESTQTLERNEGVKALGQRRIKDKTGSENINQKSTHQKKKVCLGLAGKSTSIKNN